MLSEDNLVMSWQKWRTVFNKWGGEIIDYKWKDWVKNNPLVLKTDQRKKFEHKYVDTGNIFLFIFVFFFKNIYEPT